MPIPNDSPDDILEHYTIEEHTHRFAAWAASRGASVKGCRFRVERGRELLEACGFVPHFSTPDQLPEPSQFDTRHREWRKLIVHQTENDPQPLTHGVAAKLINLYLKTRFVCGGHHEHPRVAAIHPPIDGLLLRRLARTGIVGNRRIWRRLELRGWSNFNSKNYQTAIRALKQLVGSRPLWTIEAFWPGHQ